MTRATKHYSNGEFVPFLQSLTKENEQPTSSNAAMAMLMKTSFYHSPSIAAAVEKQPRAKKVIILHKYAAIEVFDCQMVYSLFPVS